MPESENEKLYAGAAMDIPTHVTPCATAYAELDVTSNYSFLRGASHPDELVYQAALLGYRALAITDINSLAGVVRAYEAARKIAGFQLIIGVRLIFTDDTPDLLVWPSDRDAYTRLCHLLTLGRRRAPKGECHLTLPDFLAHSQGQHAALCFTHPTSESQAAQTHHSAALLREAMGHHASIAISLSLTGDDTERLHAATELSTSTAVPLLATNHVHYHHPARRPLQDVLTCTRHGCTIHTAGHRLFPNAERYLKSPEHMHQLFASHPKALKRTLEIAQSCTFSLAELKYEYPTEAVPKDIAPSDHLRALTYAGAHKRYPAGIPEKVTALIEKELKFICGSKYESYFLTVHDLVREAESRSILCQGRGSAANSAVCYCLGVTAVDPDKFQLVFERFASDARAEPPDIDIDFEHERREEIIQYVYTKYGRTHAGMTASLITYRGRSAVRDVGKALGFTGDLLDQLADKLDWWHRGTLSPSQLAETGIDPADPLIRQLLLLTSELLGFPRHLSQHVGGMVISRSPLCDLVPIENASMQDRTVIEWDKDDLDIIGLFKVDILALGMLTALSKGLTFINQSNPNAPELLLRTIPFEDPDTYEMACDADTVGVFQIESRAQMSMLPRLQPRQFYDLVIEVAIVRPGPIQGKMVHPYLQRREEQRQNPNYTIPFPSEELRQVLKETLGVPLFQEQAMRLAVVAAGFTPTEADTLRRAMAAWKRHGGLEHLRDKFINGMLARNYQPDFAEQCFQQISGFGKYGFPESHAASFAKLVYASAWIKRHHPAAFAAALLNSQPMGFYAPAQLVRDAREHGVPVRPLDINASHWDSTLEHDAPTRPAVPTDKRTWGHPGPALRLGLRQVKGLREADAHQISHARQLAGPFTSVSDLQRRANLETATIQRLARADAFASLNLSRRKASWESLALSNHRSPLLESTHTQPHSIAPRTLPEMPMIQEVFTDYGTTGLSLKRHPVAFARPALTQLKIIPNISLRDAVRYPNGARVSVAGLVLIRQRPGTASGVVFITLEDETGIANLILWSPVYERFRPIARHATLLQTDGILQREGKVIHVLAHRLFDRTPLIPTLNQPSRDFH